MHLQESGVQKSLSFEFFASRVIFYALVLDQNAVFVAVVNHNAVV